MSEPETLIVIAGPDYWSMRAQMRRGGYRAKVGRHPGPHANTIERGRRWAALYESGMSAIEIAQQEGTWPAAVYRALKVAGVEMRSRGRKSGILDEDRAAVFARRYLGGETLQRIADDFGITRERVRQVLRKTGVDSLGRRPEHMRQARPLTDNEKEAAKLYEAGVRPREIHKCFPEVILGPILKKVGVKVKPRGVWQIRPDDDRITREVAELYRSGFKAQEIADRVEGVQFAETVYRYLAKAGISPSRRGGYKRGELEAIANGILRLWEAGRSVTQISEAYGASYGAVFSLLKRHGVQPSRRKVA